MFTMKIRGVNTVIKNLEQIRDLVNQEVEKIHVLGMTKFQTKAQENESAVATGTLRRSIHISAPGISHENDFDNASQDNPSNIQPISKTEKFTKKGHLIKSYVGTWLKYGKKIHRDGGIDGKGKWFLKKALKSERKEVRKFIRDEIKKMLIIGANMAKKLS